MRVATTVLELLGIAALVAGVAMIYVPAAFIVGGLALVVMSFLIERGGR